MILHFYSVETPLYFTKIHNGHGLGSIFARISGKIASKAAAKTIIKAAVSAAKTVGKKTLKTAVKEAIPLAKQGIKQGITEATKYGTEKALYGINSVAEKAINKGVPTDIVHKISTTVERGVKRQAGQISRAATEKLQEHLDKAVKKTKAKLHQNLIDAL